MNIHDAVIQRLNISIQPGGWRVALSVTVEGHGLLITFNEIWWIGLDGAAIIAYENQVISIDEIGWDAVPVNSRYQDGGYTVYAIQFSSVSKVIVVARAIVSYCKESIACFWILSTS